MTHLNALELRLSNERTYLSAAKSEGERVLRGVWISQIEKEIAGEIKFLGERVDDGSDMTDDELLAALIA